jgi:dynein heavy chain
MSKFVYADKSLFTELILDIFPNVTGKIKSKDHKELGAKVRELLADKNLVNKYDFFLKIIQLYETSTVRHGFMVVGRAGCGKTTIYNVLCQALSELPDNPNYNITKMNPKALKGTEMYGTLNQVGEWEDGVFSNIWKKLNAKGKKTVDWIQCDGPVDAIWIENLNTVLDDNKILTLANAERIPMHDNTKMTFEVENLDNASPATVSRCGQVFVSPNELSWEPLFEAWAGDRADKGEPGMLQCNPDEQDWIKELTHKYFIKSNIFVWLEKNMDRYVMYTPEVIRVTQMINLLTACFQEYSDVRQEVVGRDTFEKIWVYCYAWSIAGLFEAEDRLKFHTEVLEKMLKAPLPPIAAGNAQKPMGERESVFDFSIDPETKAWTTWAPEEWAPPRKIVFSQLLIPTSDSTRAEYIIKKIASLKSVRSEKRKENGMLNTLLVGSVGTAKTSTILMYANKFDPAKMGMKRINFSFYTLPHNF